MLTEVREVLRVGLKKEFDELKISIYQARIDKVTIGGCSINTINNIIKLPTYIIRNGTQIKLLKHIGVPYDRVYFKENNVVKLLDNEA
jgi:hypothetical protein